MTTIIVIAIVAVCVVAGLLLWSRSGADGGPARYTTERGNDRDRLARRLERNRTFDKVDEKRRGDESPPTHEKG